MPSTLRKWALVTMVPASWLPVLWISGRAADGAGADEREWPGLHKDGKPFTAMNLNDTKVKVDFLYHGPGDAQPRPLEGRIVRESGKEITIGITVRKTDVAFSAYDKTRKTLEIYLTPHHLADPKEVRTAILHMTEFPAPTGLQAVRVIYLP